MPNQGDITNDASAPDQSDRLPATLRLTDVDINAIARLGADVDNIYAMAGEASSDYGMPVSPEEKAKREADQAERLRVEELRRNKAASDLRHELTVRLNDAYTKGVASATDSEARREIFARSMVLLLVVLAVVLMPILAMAIHLSPTDFGTYIAPVTGIAGTVVGYWFGSADRAQSTAKK